MNGVHDMGGMHGFGPIPWEEHEPVFHEPWEGRAYALNASGNVPWYPNTSAFRFALESLPPARYLSLSYYERWLAVMEQRAIELGLTTAEEIAQRIALFRDHPETPMPQHHDPALDDRARARMRRGRSPHRPEGAPPRFAVGDRVTTRNIHPAGHTRLPRYARGKPGLIHRVHGSHDFPDTDAHGRGANPQGAYSVRFEAADLWGPDAEPSAVYLDLWDAYLEPRPEPD